MNKRDFQDGDVVSFLDTPYTRTLGTNYGIVVHSSNTLGVLVKLLVTPENVESGMFYANEEGELCNKHAYFFANQIQCVKV